MSNKPLKAKNTGPKGAVAQARRALFAAAHKRISAALEAGYFLEAITIIESILADRLEARLAWIHGKCHFSTLGTLVGELSGRKSSESAEARQLYNEILQWADRRNRALHQMVKLAEGSNETWAEKYEQAHDTAIKGEKLARKVENLVRTLNKPSKAPACLS
jgi:hypothetical protein